ncbi:hypothetical protein M1523_04450 [Patescibacteria group bacterium]|nr:hypothetical protein [Patescibacteria group bacterium]MCL5091527.1 hypothetical protein [Patescibacteria group bacterium]
MANSFDNLTIARASLDMVQRWSTSKQLRTAENLPNDAPQLPLTEPQAISVAVMLTAISGGLARIHDTHAFQTEFLTPQADSTGIRVLERSEEPDGSWSQPLYATGGLDRKQDAAVDIYGGKSQQPTSALVRLDKGTTVFSASVSGPVHASTVNVYDLSHTQPAESPTAPQELVARLLSALANIRTKMQV